MLMLDDKWTAEQMNTLNDYFSVSFTDKRADELAYNVMSASQEFKAFHL